MGSRNRGTAAPALICSDQTVLLDIWEEGSKADVLRGPSAKAIVQASSCSAAFVRCAMAPRAPEQPTQEREVNVPARGSADWGVPLRLRGESESGTGEQKEEGKSKLSSKNSRPRRNTRPGLGALDS